MTWIRISLALWLAYSSLAGALALADPPTCTTHFFDWYVIDNRAALQEKQKQWTYQVDWHALGIAPDEIGTSVHYYEVQCRKIREAGFDGIHYEWHGNPVKPPFQEALQKTGLPVAMFYDMQIRFHGRPDFITPTAEFADQFVRDVVGFYRPIARSLWLRDRNGRLPIIVYGYAFEGRVSDPEPWDRFYRAIIADVQTGLDAQVVFHWTNNGSPQQMYGYQHFPQIQSFTFNEASGQPLAGARSVTFVVHYDDLGVSFARGGPRTRRWIRNDIRYLQEALWLAKHTNPDLVFNYGWNELYEGEHLLPDRLWGMWRYRLAAAMVRDIKSHAKMDLPRVLVIVDDFLLALHGAAPERAAVLRRQMSLLTRLRSLVPQADVVLPGGADDLADYDIIFSLNSSKTPAQDSALARFGKRVVYANPDMTADTPMTRRFTRQARRLIERPDRGPANEYVVTTRKVDVDLRQYPLIQFRARNTPGALFHIRYWGINTDGKEVQAWYETSPSDDRATGGRWLEDTVNLAELASQGAGEPVERLSRIEVILDDLEISGSFCLDLDYLRVTNAAGESGWSDDFVDVADWSAHASFEGTPGAQERFALGTATENGTSLARISLQAIVTETPADGLDESSRMIEPMDGVRTLRTISAAGVDVPVLLAGEGCYWLNTYSPDDECWAVLFGELSGAKLNRGVLFQSYSHRATPDGLTSDTNQSLMVIGDEPLPLDRIRLVAPPELDQPLEHTLPNLPGHMELQVIRGSRRTIPLPDPGSDPPAVTLLPGEVVEVVGRR